MRPWRCPTPAGAVAGRVVVPGSKSASARALVLAALADAPSELSGVLDSRDTRLMRAGLASLGVGVDDVSPGLVRVTPRGWFMAAPVSVGLAGTVMRFLPPMAALADGRSPFTGDRAAEARPIAPLLDGLGQLGVAVEHPEGLPFAVRGDGGVHGSEATIDASASSQFISGLLLSAPHFDAGLTLHHAGATVPSPAYVGMTVEMLRRRGVRIEQPDATTWRVEPGPIAARDESVETDLINAATFLAAGMVTGGRVEMPWPELTLQAGDAVLAALEAFGAVVERGEGTIAVGADHLAGADVDLFDVSELTPVLTAVACLAEGPSRLRGVGHIRHHETDRLAALAAEFSALGADVREASDGLVITPGRLHGGTFHTYADHRMAHAGAVAGLRVTGIELDDVSCTTKTMPDFPGLWQELVG
ncbi:3-phosphoshikimate 1-carboxyvinyltransferase [Nigerium massiliense]|uniref:3-phosphoshikimate 1-carboxyvinyltransferase n=1 Tax=Nigerium massiliense TaxID=1522317 RepID=UPI00058E4C86|nr:3-phosphoshikimate 1-carboxyvinyltransferase [Nigerium massiliense]